MVATRHRPPFLLLSMALAGLAPGARAGCELPAAIDLGDLAGGDGFALHGTDVADGAGFSVAGGVDVDGDGHDDVIVGAPGADAPGRQDSGRTYVVYGKAGAFPASFDLVDLDGSNGFVLDGATDQDHSGWSAAGAGDVNGDGIDDLIVGAPAAENLGRAYVVFGSAAFPASLDLGTLDGSTGFAILGAYAGSEVGASVAGGDVDGDGFADVIVGSPDGGSGSEGAVHVVYGRSTAFPPTIDIQALDGTIGFTITGNAPGDRAGFSVATADVDDDGDDDLLIGAPDADPDGNTFAGRAYVVYGRAVFPVTMDLGNLSSGGVVMDGASDDAFTGISVSGAGDVNGDDVEDLLVGAWGAGENHDGAAYVVFGDSDGLPASIELAQLDGNDGFRLDGIADNDNAGFDVAGGGDVNDDGRDDLLVGARTASPLGRTDAGQSYVLYGHSGVWPASRSLATLDGRIGITVDGDAASAESGTSIAGAGDVNGDGIADVVVGAYQANGITGAAYVVLGSAGGGASDHGSGEGQGPANPSRVRIHDAAGAPTAVDFLAYAAGGYGCNVARGDIGDACGVDILTGPGPSPGLGPWVRAFDATGAVLAKASAYAFGTLRYGVTVAAADVDADGVQEILAGAGGGGVFGPHVRGFDYDGTALQPIAGMSFFAFSRVGYGVNVAGGNGDGDAAAELVAGPGPGPVFAARVRGFDYAAGAVTGIAKTDFTAYPDTFGTVVAVGDVDGDGIAEIATAPGAGDVNRARYRGFTFGASALPGFDLTLSSGTYYGGRVAAGDLDFDGDDDLLTALGPDPAAGATVRSYRYDTVLKPITSFDPFPSDAHGASVASW